MRCGKQLPSLNQGIQETPAGIPAPPPPPVPPQVDPFETVFDRPLTDTELDALKRVQRSPAIGATKVLATLFGIAPPLLILLAFMGTPFDPTAFPMVMFGAAVIAVLMGGISFNRRYPVGIAMARGTVREARGIPRKNVRGSGQVAIQVGDIEFVSTAKMAEALQDGRMNAVIFTIPNANVQGRGLGSRTWIIGANGVTLPQPVPCSISPTPDIPGHIPPPPPAYMHGGK